MAGQLDPTALSRTTLAMPASAAAHKSTRRPQSLRCRLNPKGILSRVEVVGICPDPNFIVPALEEAAMTNFSNSGNSREEHAEHLARETPANHEAGTSTTFSPSDRRSFLQGAAA